MDELLQGLALGVVGGAVVGGFITRWLRGRMVQRRALRMWRELQAREEWQASGLGAFGLPPLPATALADTPSQLAGQLADIRDAYDAIAALRADNTKTQAEVDRMRAENAEIEARMTRRYCPKCGEEAIGMAFLCDYHLARVRPSRAFVLALPSMVAHPNGLYADDWN